MHTELLINGASVTGFAVVACEPVVLTRGFVLCHEPGDTTLLHVHDHRKGPNPVLVAVIVQNEDGWSARSIKGTITRSGIVDAFEEWIEAQLNGVVR